MTEPYKKVGRGGAGNFYSKPNIQESARPSQSSDLESQPQSTSLAHPISSSQPPPEYQHTGRGGAGNWIQPSELSSHGLAQVASLSSADATSAPGSKTVGGQSKPTYRGGRGGAGNYVDFAEEERARREEEERVRRVAEERVVRDVEAGLARPPKAYGGLGGAWEMGDMK